MEILMMRYQSLWMGNGDQLQLCLLLELPILSLKSSWQITGHIANNLSGNNCIYRMNEIFYMSSYYFITVCSIDFADLLLPAADSVVLCSPSHVWQSHTKDTPSVFPWAQTPPAPAAVSIRSDQLPGCRPSQQWDCRDCVSGTGTLLTSSQHYDSI